MWFAKVADSVIGWFVVKSNTGDLLTGKVSGDFVCTIVNPSDTTTTVVTVTESSAKPGLYKFTIPTTFFTTHGVGIYAVVLVIAAPSVKDVASYPLKIAENDFDTIGNNTVLIPALL